jgi:ankyrin repeat protein
MKDRKGLTAEHWAAKYGHFNLMLFMGQQLYR